MKRLWVVCICAGWIAAAPTSLGQIPFFKNPAKPAAPAKGVGKGIGIFTNALDLIGGFRGVPIEEELQIGGSVAVEIVARFGGLYRDTNATRRVTLVGRSLARYGNRPDLTYRFGILNSPEVNAFSAPGGYIFITRGLYDQARTDDQLAGVLAHEIAHVTERHALRMISRGKAVSAGLKIGAATTKEVRDFGQGIESFTRVLFEQGFDTQTEYSADDEGRRLARVTGYSPDGLREVLERLHEHKDGSLKIFSTHPSLNSRIDRLR